MPIPGGGRIMYSTGDGVGVLEADGSESHLGGWPAVDAFWDPIHPGQILVNPYTNGPPRIREFRRTADGWSGVRTWPAGYGGSSQISPDGRWFAYDVFEKGRATGTVRVASRNGVVASIYGHFSSVSWTSDHRVILSRWDGSELLLWKPFRNALAPFTFDRNLALKLPSTARKPWLDASHLSWSSDGRLFAAPIHWRERGFRSGVAVGSLTDGVLATIGTGATLSAPTWSPTRPEIAFVFSRSYGDPAAALYVYDVTTGRRTLVRRGVPNPRWVAWSPAGDWMLLDDAERTRWLFVSRDGAHTVDYSWMGSFPRWASPGFSLHIFVC